MSAPALIEWFHFVVERKLMFLKIIIDDAAIFVHNSPSGIVIHFILIQVLYITLFDNKSNENILILQ